MYHRLVDHLRPQRQYVFLGLTVEFKVTIASHQASNIAAQASSCFTSIDPLSPSTFSVRESKH